MLSFHPHILTLTPNCSTTSTISVGSTGSQARLVHSSNTPSNYQPILMKDLGKTTAITTNKSESNNTIISSSCSYKNSVIGSSVSSFKSTLMTLNQLRSEAQMKSSSSSPQQSPDQDIEIIEIFPELPDSNQHSNENGREPSLSEQTNTCVMDKHLSDLEHDNLNAKIQYDIVKYMKNLREKTLEAKAAEVAAANATPTVIIIEQKNNEEEQPQADSPEPPTVVENTLPSQKQITEVKVTEKSNENNKPTKSEDESEGSQKLSSSYSPPTPVKIDKKVDKVFRSKSLDKIKRSSLKSTGTKLPRHNIYIATDRSKSQGSSPVRIVKVKSSSRSSRENSEERLEPRRSSEGGILKRPSSPSCIHSILKSKSPDRSCLKKITHDCSLESNSPRVSPRSSFRQAHSVCLHSIMKSPKQSSFENRSPERNGRKRSVSAHSSLDVPKGSCYQYLPINDYQHQQRISASVSSSRRQSKSLERSTSRDSSPYYYSVSPDRIYRINTDMSTGPMRSVSAENALMHHSPHQVMNNRSYDCELNYRYNSEAVNRALENMTCVECLYSRKPS